MSGLSVVVTDILCRVAELTPGGSGEKRIVVKIECKVVCRNEWSLRRD